mmetsp:Transcript_19367/g.39535  ORF Transcript_19367/g.39535 Transcript_19367/m.39535 type:complete len:209 (-) Transcript_19367:293-919(-)
MLALGNARAREGGSKALTHAHTHARTLLHSSCWERWRSLVVRTRKKPSDDRQRLCLRSHVPPHHHTRAEATLPSSSPSSSSSSSPHPSSRTETRVLQAYESRGERHEEQFAGSESPDRPARLQERRRDSELKPRAGNPSSSEDCSRALQLERERERGTTGELVGEEGGNGTQNAIMRVDRHSCRASRQRGRMREQPRASPQQVAGERI